MIFVPIVLFKLPLVCPCFHRAKRKLSMKFMSKAPGNKKCYFITLLWRELTSQEIQNGETTKQKEKQETQSCEIILISRIKALVSLKGAKITSLFTCPKMRIT